MRYLFFKCKARWLWQIAVVSICFYSPGEPLQAEKQAADKEVFAGSINAVFADKKAAVLILPTHEKDIEAQKKIHSFAENIRNKRFKGRPIITDNEALDKDLSANALVVYGTPAGNAWLAKHISQIPVQILPDRIVAGDTYIGKHLKFITAWPNPQNLKKGMVIYTAQHAEDIIYTKLFHGSSDYVVAEAADGDRILDALNYEKKGSPWKFPDSNSLLFKKTFSTAELKADLDFFVKTLEDVHPNLYAYTPKAEIEKERKRIEQALATPMTRKKFYLLTAPLVARFNDGHTVMSPPDEESLQHAAKGGLLFPLVLHFEGNRTFILDSCLENASDLEGAELTAINNMATEQILQRLLAYISGEQQAWRMEGLKNYFSVMIWLVYGFEAPFEIAYIPRSGTVCIKKLDGACLDAIQKKIYVAKKDYEYHLLPEDKTAVLDFRSFNDPQRFKAFLQEMFGQIRKENMETLIVDIRNNYGGNSALGDELLSYITEKPVAIFPEYEIKVSKQVRYAFEKNLSLLQRTAAVLIPDGKVVSERGGSIKLKKNSERFSGRVYVLIDSGTFSSASSFAAAMKDNKLGILIGEETGGLATSYGDIYSFKLPNSKLRCGVSYKHFVRPSGQDDGRGVLPDYEVKPSLEDLIQGRDTVLEFTRKLIKSNKPHDLPEPQ